MNRRLYRSVSDRKIGGVAAGTAAYFDIDPSISRVLWLLLAIVTGGAFLIVYLVMWAVVPEEPDFTMIDRVIFSELVDGVFSDASRQAYVEAIERLAARGCDAVALVCTEIPLLVRPQDSPLPTLDSTRLLARAALTHALA